MRTFSTDSPEFFAFQLEGHDEVFKVPLLASLRISEAKAWTKATEDGFLAQVEWLRGYIGDVTEELSVDQAQEILRAWTEATREQGATAGESSASSN